MKQKLSKREKLRIAADVLSERAMDRINSKPRKQSVAFQVTEAYAVRFKTICAVKGHPPSDVIDEFIKVYCEEFPLPGPLENIISERRG